MPAEVVADKDLTENAPEAVMSGWMDSVRALTADAPPPEKPKEGAKDADPKPAPSPGTAADHGAVAGGRPADPAPKAAAEPKAEDAAAAAAAAAGDEDEKVPRTKEDWERFKSKRKEREAALKADIAARDAKIKEFESKLTKPEGEPVASPEVEKYLKELEEHKKLNEQLTEKIMLLDVTSDPRFVKYFNDKTNHQIELAKKIVGPEKAEAMAQTLQLSDDGEYGELKAIKLEELMDGLSDIQKARVGSVLNSLSEISSERASEITKARELREAKLAKDGDQAKQMAAMREQTFSKVVKSIQSKDNGFAAYIERDGDENWNKSVRDRIATANRMLTGEGMKPEDIMQAALHAAAMPAVLEAYKQDITEKDATITKLQEQVKAMQSAQPGAGTSPKPSAVDAPERVEIKHGMSPFEASQAWANSVSRGMRQE